MTTLRLLTDFWNWHSPAWVVALDATCVYLLVAVRRGVSIRQLAFFAAALGAFLVALASPLAALASRYLFSAHMAQHLLLLLIVPLCAMLAWPSQTADVDVQTRRQRPIGTVPIGWAAGVGAMWFWHIPALCTASMRSGVIFDIQIVSLIAAGAAFWWPVFSPIASARMQPQLAAAYLFSGCLGCSLLGIYITFSPISVCPLYDAPTGSSAVLNLIRNQWGLTHRIDQQVGGLLMWVPACMIYLGAILVSLASWYRVPNSTFRAPNSLATE